MKDHLRNISFLRLPDLRARLIAVWVGYRQIVLSVAAFALAGLLALGSAVLSVNTLERVVTRDISAALQAEALTWAEVGTDGLLVFLSGEAATEAERFRAIGLASGIVAAERVIDQMTVKPSVAVAAPRFSIEVLRNGLDVSLIGLVPESFDVSAITRRIEGIGNEVSVVNMLEAADHTVPFGWEQAVDFGMIALAMVPVSKISIASDQVEIYGLAQSDRERDDFRTRLMRARPRGLVTSIDISAPRPAITPFTLRFVRDENGARFDACSADSVEARAAILQAARQAGATGVLECTIGLGTPSPRWQAATVAAIRLIGELGAGTITFSDTDVSLVVPATITVEQLDQAATMLQGRLPDIFSLQATRLLPEADILAAQRGIEFVALRNTEGLVTLRGRLTDDRLNAAVQALARSAFGLSAVQMRTDVDPDTPEGWPLRALLAIDVLSQLEHGQVRVRPGQIDIAGVTGDAGASDRIAQMLAEKLGQGAVFNMNLTYDERFDPVAMQPTPARCEAWIAEILGRQQITFDPGSTTIVAGATKVVDEIAEVLRSCGRLEMEVAGHTDSQGRLDTNMRLSQQRAEAVIAGLLARGVPVSDLVAKGYGPEFPIADNGTAAGREANRRIEFRLIGASAEAARAEVAEVNEDLPPPEELPDEADLTIAVTSPAGNAPRPQPRPERR
jgi:OmpA-OmpF porin, OOP family